MGAALGKKPLEPAAYRALEIEAVITPENQAIYLLKQAPFCFFYVVLHCHQQ